MQRVVSVRMITGDDSGDTMDTTNTNVGAELTDERLETGTAETYD